MTEDPTLEVMITKVLANDTTRPCIPGTRGSGTEGESAVMQTLHINKR